MWKGILCSVSASVLFGTLYYYVSLLKPMNGWEVLGWRVLLTLPMVTVFIIGSKEWDKVRAVWLRVKMQPVFFLALIFNSALMGVQFWLFMWAPMNGRALSVSLGYFLLPLALVCLGRFVYGEKLSVWKKAASICAALGVANEIYYVGYIAWETLVVALGYTLYFYLRRRFELNHIGGLWYDIALMLPASLWFISQGDLSWEILASYPSFYYLIPGLGVLGTVSWLCYVLASRLLPFSLFGLLGYLEPVLLVCVSLMLGESINVQELPTYVLIWIAILLLVIEGVKFIRRTGRYSSGKAVLKK